MPETLKFLLVYSIAVWIGIWLYAQILLPILYGFPKAVAMYRRREVKFSFIGYQLAFPLALSAAAVFLGFVLAGIAPRLLEGLIYDPAINFGQWTAIALLLLNFLRARGREDMKNDVERAAARFRKEPNQPLARTYGPLDDGDLEGLQERADEAWWRAAQRSYDREMRRWRWKQRKWVVTCWFKRLPGKLAEVVMRRPR